MKNLKTKILVGVISAVIATLSGIALIALIACVWLVDGFLIF